MTKQCSQCNTILIRPTKQSYSYWEKRQFCNKQCEGLFKKGSNLPKKWAFNIKKSHLKGHKHPKWKGGRIVRKGYVYVKTANHPNSITNNYILEHHLVVEKYLKRYLKSTEIIHHIDGNTENNDINNLYLFPSQSEHRKYHWDILKNKIKPITKSNL